MHSCISAYQCTNRISFGWQRASTPIISAPHVATWRAGIAPSTNSSNEVRTRVSQELRRKRAEKNLHCATLRRKSWKTRSWSTNSSQTSQAEIWAPLPLLPPVLRRVSATDNKLSPDTAKLRKWHYMICSSAIMTNGNTRQRCAKNDPLTLQQLWSTKQRVLASSKRSLLRTDCQINICSLYVNITMRTTRTMHVIHPRTELMPKSLQIYLYEWRELSLMPPCFVDSINCPRALCDATFTPSSLVNSMVLRNSKNTLSKAIYTCRDF